MIWVFNKHKIRLNWQDLVSILLIVPLVVSVLSSWIGYLFGFQPSFYASIFSIIIIATFLLKKHWKVVFFTLLYGLIVVLISTYIYDRSWDGSCYHQEAIIQLTDNYNPVFSIFKGEGKFKLPLNHYPKNAWLSSTWLYDLTNNPESSKSVNLFAITICVLSLISFLKELNFSVFKILLSVFIVFSNPVVWFEMFTTQVDGYSYCWLVLFAIGLIRIYWQKNLKLGYLLIIVSTLLIHSKFTMPVYIIIEFIFITTAYFILNRKINILKNITSRKIVLPFLCVVLILVVSGLNPYLYNLHKYSHVFYPAMGEFKIDLIGFMERPELYMNRFKAFAYSHFYIGPFLNGIGFEPGEFLYKIFKFPETSEGASGGFGIGFLFLVISTFLILIFNLKKDRITLILLLSLVFLLSGFLIHEAFIARFVPHMWLGLSTIIIIALKYNLKCKKTAVIFVLIPISYCVYGLAFNGYIQIKNTRDINSQLASLKGNYNVELGDKPAFRKVIELKVPNGQFKYVEEIECESPVVIKGSTLILCPN